MSVFKKYLVGLLLTTIFVSCKNDIDVLADWKQNTVVYGLLDQSETTHYIKVGKVYLGEGSAIDMAQIQDSLYYKNNVSVVVERWKGSTLVTSYQLNRDSSIAKNPGDFLNPKQILYTFTAPLFDDSQYRLSIKDAATGHTVTGQTSLIKSSLSIARPTTNQVMDFANYNRTFDIQWNAAAGARIYQVFAVFHYKEYGLTDTVVKSITWPVSEVRVPTLNGGDPFTLNIDKKAFYKYIAGAVSNGSNVFGREPLYLDVLFTAAADDLATFIEVGKPSTGIVQERPEYTNLTGGYGIFSARYTTGVYSRPFNARTLDSLCSGQYTKNLNFCY
ncbi:MAG: hypothetical protein J0M08_08375 [Bacteroidetes bacterium]|nr:hypothetical protein [Bacteroidota bacterium]